MAVRVGDMINGKFGIIGERQARCEVHGEYTDQQMRALSREWWAGCPMCAKERAESEERKRQEKEAAERQERIVRNAIKQAAIPPRFLERTLENYVTETEEQAGALRVSVRYAETFEEATENGRSLIFCGTPGTGKTHLATGIAQRIITRGYTAAFTTTMNAIRRIRETYKKTSTETEGEAIRSFTVPDLLILDEVGTQRGTDDEKVLLFDIINTRYESMRPMIVISNLDLKGVQEYLGERAFDRLREGGGRAVQFTWQSHRRSA